MEAQLEHPAEEIERLRRCINDLFGVVALPAVWGGGEPAEIVRALTESLLGMLRLELIYVRLGVAVGEPPVELLRVAQTESPTAEPREFGELLDRRLGADPQKWPAQAQHIDAGGEMTLVPLRLGLQGELGLVVAGSRRADFPLPTERLVLSVAATQATVGLQQALLVQDVTQRRLSEEALGNLRSELAHVSRVATLGALTASIAHEVNQPLSGIITNASTCLRMLAADPPNVDGARETARRTIRDGHRAADVITRLRALFGKKDVTSEPVDLNEATREVIALSLSELRRNRVIPRLELADDLPPVTGDRVQLQQVILNLLLNALDAMSGVEDCPTPLVIRTARDGDDRVRLSVQDAGVGFAPQAAERLFEPFFTTKNDGMGIGLSVSRSIIESHHGRLWATLNDGPGVTFSFSIPHTSEAATDASGVEAIRTPAVTDAEHVRGDS